MRHFQVICLAIAIPLVVSACRRTRPIVPVPEINPALPSAMPADTNGTGEDRAVREREEAERERIRNTLAIPIHFDFDRSDLSLEARAGLDEKLAILRANPVIHLRIEGHADERGSSEYNLALGLRRAAAARRYLVQREIAPERLEITSFGEERPRCEGGGEACWRANRRDEFVMIAPQW